MFLLPSNTSLNRKCIKIGITGGIGSGKSQVSHLIRTMGFPVYDADTESKRLCRESDSLRMALQDEFGNIYLDNGELNRQKFAEIIFSDKEKRLRANDLIHPAVQNDFLAWTERQGASFVFVESAILLESILKKAVDMVIVVTADKSERITRILLRDKCSRKMAARRINSQMDDDIRIAQADYIIRNNNRDLVIPQVERIVRELTGCCR